MINIESFNFKEIYEFHYTGLIVKKGYLKELHRDEIITIRNYLENLWNVRKIIDEKDLWTLIKCCEVRYDIEILWINVNRLKELIDRINEVIIEQSIIHKNREW